MRRSLLATLLAAALLARPATAQRIPTPTPVADPAAGGRVLLDMTVTVVPQEPTTVCPILEAGRLDVTVRAVGQGQPRPVAFNFYGVRGIDPEADTILLVTAQEQAASVPLRGGSYCTSLTNEAATSPDAGIDELTGLRQGVSIRMTLTPQ